MQDDILTKDEIRWIKNQWIKWKRFKIELEDLLQEARLAKWKGKNIQKALEEYYQNWSQDPLSYAKRDKGSRIK